MFDSFSMSYASFIYYLFFDETMAIDLKGLTGQRTDDDDGTNDGTDGWKEDDDDDDGTPRDGRRRYTIFSKKYIDGLPSKSTRTDMSELATKTVSQRAFFHKKL